MSTRTARRVILAAVLAAGAVLAARKLPDALRQAELFFNSLADGPGWAGDSKGDGRDDRD